MIIKTTRLFNRMEFVLNNKNILNFLNQKNVKKFELKEYDSNFWNFFIIWKGLGEYEKLFNQTKLLEKQLKLEFQEKLANKKIKGKAEAIDNLHDNKTSLKTITLLASLENVNILFMDNRSYYYCKNNDSDQYVVFGETEPREVNLEEKIKRPTINHSLNPISGYKLNELRVMHNLTGLPLKKTKQELYDELIQYLTN